MRRLLLALAALLPASPVSADMYQDASNADQPAAAMKLGTPLNPMHYGAVMDGASHPLSGVYPTLAAAQADCPKASSLTQQRDWCAMQRMVDYAQTISQVPGEQGGDYGIRTGIEIRLPPGSKLNTGATPVRANLASLAISGDEATSVVYVSNTGGWWLEFGLDNRMGPKNVQISTRGNSFEIGEDLTITGGTCATKPVLKVTDITDGGGINNTIITNAGNCSVVPPNPLAYTTGGEGLGASINGTFTGTALTSTAFGGTGAGCVVGDILTAQGGSVQPGAAALIPATFRVTNVSGGVIQTSGIVIETNGEYGTPPTNPVLTTGTGTCTGAQVNISNMSNRGGSLSLKGLQFIATAPNVGMLKAQFNSTVRSMSMQNLKGTYTGDNNWAYIADLTAVNHSLFENIFWLNNLSQILNNQWGFVVREQNTLSGHYGHVWNQVHVKQGWIGGGWNYKLQGGLGFQGIYFKHSSFGSGTIGWLMENTSLGPTTYSEIVWEDSLHQSLQFVDIKHAKGVRVQRNFLRQGEHRLPPGFPAGASTITFRNVNSSWVTDNHFSAINDDTPNITFVDLREGTSANILRNNQFHNNLNFPNVVPYAADATTSGNNQSGDVFPSSINVPVVDLAPAYKNQWAAMAKPGHLGAWGKATSFSRPAEMGSLIDGGSNPISGGMGEQRWYAPARSAADVLAIPTASTCYAVPVYVPHQVTVRGLAYRISTPSAGNWNARMAIYRDLGEDDVRMGPGALVPLSDTGNIAQTSATTGSNVINVNLGAACLPGVTPPCPTGASLTPGWHWLAMVYSGSNPTIGTMPSGTGWLSGQAVGAISAGTALTGSYPAVSRACSYTGTEAMPATWGTATDNAASAPIIAFRAN